MPRYASQNLAATDADFRKANNISLGGSGGSKKHPYMYGKQNNVLIASGSELFANGFCLRLLPLYAEPAGNGERQFVTFQDTSNPEMWGDWCRQMTCVHWAGNPGVCFIVHDGNPELNIYQSPYHVLRNVAWKNSSKPKEAMPHPVLGRLFDELLSDTFAKNSHIGSLKKPELTLFVSASVVILDEHGRPTLGAFTDDVKKNARIVGLKTSAAHALRAACMVQDESTHEFLCGDMLSFGGAKLVTFLPETYNGDGKNRSALSAAGIDGVKVPKFAQQNNPVIVGYPPNRSSMTHFAVIHDGYQGQEISLEPYAERIVEDSLSWDEYLNTPTYEEQAEILASRFPREALDFAWREFPEYLRYIPTGRTTVSAVTPSDDDLLPENPPVKAVPRPVPPQAAAPVLPQAPWDPPPGELSADEEAGVADMFNTAAAPAVPSGAATAPPPPPAQVAPVKAPGGNSSADILARARARAAASNR